jgi:hypothetical protein
VLCSRGIDKNSAGIWLTGLGIAFHRIAKWLHCIGSDDDETAPDTRRSGPKNVKFAYLKRQNWGDSDCAIQGWEAWELCRGAPKFAKGAQTPINKLGNGSLFHEIEYH